MIDKISPGKRYTRYLLSLAHKHQHCRHAIQQIHSHFLVLNTEDIGGILTLWNAILKSYSLDIFPQESIFLFKFLKNKYDHMPFDSFTYSYLIKACANEKQVEAGNQFHCLSAKVGFDRHVYVQTALVNMYMECACLVEARYLFDKMPKKNLVSWNVLITGFIKWGKIGFARSVFDVMPDKNVISWTGLIDGYTRLKQFDEALLLFRKMAVDEGIKPTEVTLLAIFPAIWNAGLLNFCQVLHAHIEKCGFNILDVRVINCLIDAYAKCGSIKSAVEVFDNITASRRNLVSWTSIISGYAMHGMAAEASNCYKIMENEGLKPNRITFLTVLNACSHGGLVDKGLEFYQKMVDDYSIAPDIKLYGSLIDMLGRAGRLEEAERIALGIPYEIVNVIIWRTLLGACSFHGNVEMGERVARKIVEMESKYGGDYVLLSNIFSSAGRYADSESVRSAMDEKNASKVAGFALV